MFLNTRTDEESVVISYYLYLRMSSSEVPGATDTFEIGRVDKKSDRIFDLPFLFF